MANVQFSDLNSISSTGQITPKQYTPPPSTVGTTGYVNKNGDYVSSLGTVTPTPQGQPSNPQLSTPIVGIPTAGSPIAPLTITPQQQQTQGTPQVGEPGLAQNTQTPTSNQPQQVENTEAPVMDQIGQKYQQAFQNVQDSGTPPPTSAGEARMAISQAAPAPATPTNQPSAAFMAVGDPIMQQYMQAASQAQQEVADTGYAAQALQASVANQLQNIDIQAANLQTVMNGTRSDIQEEVGKAGGSMTESQLDAMVTARNRDILKQYNNLELQKSAMQSQMQMQVSLSQADHQFAVDKFNEVVNSSTLYKNIYTNAQAQVDKQVQNLGYNGIAQTYANSPETLRMYEKFLNIPQGTLSNPKAVAQMETYRERSLNLQASRFTASYGYGPDGQPLDGGQSQNYPGGGPMPQTNPNVSYDQYGLLSHTDFNPSNQTDKNALNYLNTYLNGTMPKNPSDIGISIRGAVGTTQYQNAVSRANNLYFAATGQNLPSPEIIKSNMALIGANNKLANNLKVQEDTVNANFGLSLQNLNANNINSAYPILNNVINGIKNAEGDPAVAQYIAQNATIQQELGNLLAVKNASGTTVYDKMAGAGLIPKNASPEQQVAVVKTLLQEAKNAAGAINNANGELYKSIDPLERQANNPNRQSRVNAPAPTDVKMTGPKGTFYVPANQVDLMKQHGYK